MPQRLKQLRILIVEDEYFLANDLERALAAEGAEVLGPVASAREAFELIDGQIHAAVLDIALGDEKVFVLADELARRQVPFAFATGYGEELIPDRFQDEVRVEKPFEAGAIVDVIARLCRPSDVRLS